MMEKNRLNHRKDQFIKSLDTLENALMRENDSDNIVRDSTIQRFEYTLEMGWKLLQCILKDERVALPINSPKKVIKAAYESDLIKNGDSWIKALDDRNDMSHMYSCSDSEGVYERIKKDYAHIFKQLKKVVDEQYS